MMIFYLNIYYYHHHQNVKRFLWKCKAGLMVHGLGTSKRSVSPCRLKEWKIRKMMDECGECRREKRKWNNHERVSLSESELEGKEREIENRK